VLGWKMLGLDEAFKNLLLRNLIAHFFARFLLRGSQAL
jgi:hypothetical protein